MDSGRRAEDGDREHEKRLQDELPIAQSRQQKERDHGDRAQAGGETADDNRRLGFDEKGHTGTDAKDENR